MLNLRYHELKIRDAKRLGLVALACVALFVVGLYFRSVVELIVNRLPTRATDEYFVLMFALAFVAVLCSYIAILYLLSSPAQNAEYIDRMTRKGRELPPQFDPTLLDPEDPYYEIRTLDYMRQTRAKR